MGSVQSNKKDESKMSLADRRYRVSETKVANAMRRRSTRKLGSVAMELGQQQGEGSEQKNCANATENETEGAEDGEEEPAGVAAGHNSQRHMRESTNRHRSQTLLHFPLSRTENAANATILLTRTQRVLVENSWKRIKKASVEGGIGAKIFHNVLIAQPDLKLLFGLEKVAQGRLKYEGQFRRHAGLLNRTLEYIIKNMQYTDKLGQHFRALGKKHCQMNGGRAFPTIYWDTFLECILQSLLETDGSISGRYHRCREAAFAWRSLISFIVQQMRRGFDDERLMRKRFSASLMGLRGLALRDAYNGTGNVPSSLRAVSGRPRPSLSQHAHCSLGSLEMMPGFSRCQHQQNNPTIAFHHNDGTDKTQRQRALSSMQQANKSVNWECKKNDRLRADGCCSSSARSASWCAEVSDDEFRRLHLNERRPRRVTRSELVIDGKCEEAFYTPTTQLRTEPFRAAGECFSPSPRIISTVQLLLSSANSEPFETQMASAERTLSTLELPNDCPQYSQVRHSFSEFDNGKQRAAAIEASKRMLEMAQKSNQLQVARGEENTSGQPRRLSAI